MVQNNEESKVLIIAHRGANKLAPENTLKAFEKAIELGADFVEFDTHASKDGEIVIMHDENTLRTAGYDGLIKDMTLEELKQLDCGAGEKIPTLKELIQLAKGKINLQLEIKAKGITGEIVKILRDSGLIDSTIISSFHHGELDKIEQLEPRLKLASLILGIRKNKSIREAKKQDYYAIHPLHRLASSKFVRKAHENGIKINAWTVDSEKRMKKLIKRGIDGLITNDVEAAKKVLGR